MAVELPASAPGAPPHTIDLRAVAEPGSPARSLARRFWARRRHRIAAAVLALFGLLALAAPVLASDLPLAVTLDGQRYWLPCLTRPPALAGLTNARLQRLQGRVDGLWLPPIPFGPAQTDLLHALAPPSGQHLLGTDRVGRDVASRLIHGGRASLAVGLFATLFAALVGLLVGALAGFLGGAWDAVLARAMEVVQTFPVLFLLLGVMALAPGAGLWTLIAVLGLSRWIEMGRLARAEALRVRSLEYVLAARALGSSERRTFALHVLPAAAGPVLVSASLAVGGMVLIESALSFLGFGVPPPTASWGELLAQARATPNAWWLATGPGLSIFLVVAGCNVLGEGLRETLAAPGRPLAKGATNWP